MIKVYGASDDLIELDGDIYEEFNTDYGTLLFSDGTMLLVQFTIMGFWKISVLQAGEAHVHWAHVAGDPHDANHSDVIHLIGGNIRFVALVDQLVWSNVGS